MQKGIKSYAFIHLTIIFFLIITFMFVPAFFYIVGVITYYSTKKKLKKRNMKHKKFEIEYFRDDLKKMSPSYISYLVDFSIETDKDVAAHVLKLYIDKYIKYENDKFVVTDKNQDDLRESDKCLISFIKSNFTDTSLLTKYKYLIKGELISDGYITDEITKRDILYLSSGFIISFIGLFSLNIFELINPNDFLILNIIKIILGIFFILGIGCFPAVLVAKILAFVKYGIGKRTSKGEELLEQIYGLKNFLKDFSIIDKRKLEEVYIQEHYLVYAITLDVNTKVDDDILKKIRKQISKNN